MFYFCYCVRCPRPSLYVMLPHVNQRILRKSRHSTCSSQPNIYLTCLPPLSDSSGVLVTTTPDYVSSRYLPISFTLHVISRSGCLLPTATTPVPLPVALSCTQTRACACSVLRAWTLAVQGSVERPLLGPVLRENSKWLAGIVQNYCADRANTNQRSNLCSND